MEMDNLSDLFNLNRNDKVELNRGMSGKYGWTIRIGTKDLLNDQQKDTVLEKIMVIDGELSKLYGKNDADKKS